MVDFQNYYSAFCERFEWCKNSLQVIRDNCDAKNKDIAASLHAKVSEHYRNCKIACRKLELIKKKYPNYENIPEDAKEIQDFIKWMILVRFHMLDNLKRSLESFTKERK